MSGEGSKRSPILISDDEDEHIHIQHTRQMASTSFSKPNQQAFRQGLPGLPPRPVMAAQSVSNAAQRVQNPGNANVNDVPRKPKRKREQLNQSLEINASSSSSASLASASVVKNLAQNGVKNKKAKHSHRGRAAARRRMAEELELPPPVQSSPGPSTFEPYSLSYPYDFDPYYHDGLGMGYRFILPENDRDSQSPYPDEDDIYESRLSSSDWVNSMARAADPLAPDLEPSPWGHEPSIPSPAPTHDHGPSQTLAFPLSSLPPLPPPPPPVVLALSVPPPPPVPSPPPLIPIPPPAVPLNGNADNKPSVTAASTVLRKLIGMPIDRDPDGKRSGFKISSNTIFQSQPHVIYPHTPTRSNTVVMEQLPKQNRDLEFIMSWGEKATGSAPVFFAVDPSSAKALVEFASHALARKAWASPKLGNHLSGLPSTDLKGKPREDLIRVWWYKPFKPDLVFTRSELEEGEIEDEIPAEALVKKETKKERKARLAKLAREEKERRKEAAIHAAALLEQEKITARRNATVEPPVSPSFTFLSAPPQLLRYGLPAPWSCPPGRYHPSHVPQQPGSSNPQTSSQEKMVIDEHRNISMAHEDKDDEVMSIEEGDFPNSSEGIGEEEETASFDDLEQPEDKLFLPSCIVSDTGDANLALSSKTSIFSALDLQMDSSPTDFLPVTLPSLSSVAAPSEPRAMKNAPKAPTFNKRALLARQKELEARIARSKLELLQRTERMQEVKVNSPIPGDIQQLHHRPTSFKSPTEEKVKPSIPVSANKDTVGVVSHKLVRENHLRNLVLASRRQKVTAVNGSDDAPVNVVTASKSLTPDSKTDVDSLVKAVVQNVATPSASNPSSPAPVPRSPVVQTSLDDLAESFIAETIQTLKPVSGQSPTPLAASQVGNFAPSSTALLAARQKQLEEQIAVSKRLMEKLMRATTKQEKDSIMASIRELSGSPNVNGSGFAPQTPGLPAVAAPKLSLPPVQSSSSIVKSVQTIDLKCMWPTESLHGGGILILSDDEDEDE